MNFNEVAFEYAAGTVKQLPASDLPEIVFSGHSNVGKSSLINKLVQRKALARVSAQPGKTATINFYKLRSCRFVDLPGYGYAKVSKAEKERWASLVEGYLSAQRNIALIVQIIELSGNLCHLRIKIRKLPRQLGMRIFQTVNCVLVAADRVFRL